MSSHMGLTRPSLKCFRAKRLRVSLLLARYTQPERTRLMSGGGQQQ